MTPVQIANIAGTGRKWIQNARRLLARLASDDTRDARWLGLAYTFHTTLDCSLRQAASLADLALATPLDQQWLRVEADAAGRVALVIDLWRDHSIYLARLAYVLATPVVERRGRPTTRRRVRQSLTARAVAYGVDISRLSAGLHRTVAERLQRLDDNAAFLAAGRASLAQRTARP